MQPISHRRMDDQINAQILGKREIVTGLDREFARLHVNSCAVIENTPAEILYVVPRHAESLSRRAPVGSTSPHLSPLLSVGESVLRSAAAIEQTFGGITANLWDDPFEWTLPEKLSTVTAVTDYLTEVAAATASGFAYLTSDGDLMKEMPAPTELKPVSQILLETLSRAEHFQGRAYAVFQMISDEKLPKL